MIDLHIHILPGIDDGPATLQEAAAMARLALDSGTSAVVATPHVAPGLFDNDKAGIIKAVQEFRSHLLTSDIPLQVYPGAEYMLEPELVEWLSAGEALTLADNGKYLLVEFPAMGVPVFAEQILFEISLQGVIPIIAHPERNGDFLRDPGKLLPLLEQGALCQGTALSFTGLFGRRVRDVALTYLREGCYSFISSDAHSDGARGPAMGGFLAVARDYDPYVGELLTSTNPELLLNGQPLLSSPVLEKNEGKKWWNFWNRL